MGSSLTWRRLVATLVPAIVLAAGAVPAHAQELDLTSSNNPSNSGEEVVITVTAHYACADGSNVWIDVDGETVASGSPLPGQSVTYTTSSLAIGDHQVEAHLSAIGPPGVNCTAQTSMTETVLPALTPVPTAAPRPTTAPRPTSAPPPPAVTPTEPPTPEPRPASPPPTPSPSPTPLASADPTPSASPDPKPAAVARPGSGTVLLGGLATGAVALLLALTFAYWRRKQRAPTG